MKPAPRRLTHPAESNTRTRDRRRRIWALLAAVLGHLTSAWAVVPGQSLASALDELGRSAHQRLIYSTAVVSPGMRVTRAPAGTTAQQQLRSILAPHGLTLKNLPGGGWAVVRAAVGVPDIARAPGNAPLDQVIVHTSRYTLDQVTVGPVLARSRVQLESTPGTDEDVARAVQQLPGSAADGISARTHVRGGYDDETLYRFDGVTLLNPYHLKDFQSLFSVIDPEVTDSVTYWSGGFPIRFGERAGAVIDMRPRTFSKPFLELGLSSLNKLLLAATPFAGGRGDAFVAVRSSNVGRLLSLMGRGQGEIPFEDLVAHVRWSASDASTLSSGIIALDDHVEASNRSQSETADARYDDVYAWARLEHAFSPAWHSRTLVSYAQLRTRRSGSLDRAAIASGTVVDHRYAALATLREEMTVQPGRSLRLLFGAQWIRGRAHYHYDSAAHFYVPFYPQVAAASSRARALDIDESGSNYSVYGSARVQLAPHTVAEVGLRRDTQTYGGNGSQSQDNVRVSVSQALSPRTTLRLGWGQYSQPQWINELDVEDGATTFAAPRRMTQSIVSLEQALPARLRLRVELYDNKESTPGGQYENVLLPLVLLPEIEVDRQRVAPTSSRMRGLELTVSSDAHRPLSWSVTYTLSSAEDRFGNQDVPRPWDQRHALQVDVQWSHGPWRAGLLSSWHSGWPYTPLEASSTSWTDPAAVTLALGARDSARYGNFLSFDGRVSYHMALPVGSLGVSLELRNLLDRDNPCCTEYEVRPTATGTSELVGVRRDWLSFTPILGVRWRY